jgi:hypothetical protein
MGRRSQKLTAASELQLLNYPQRIACQGHAATAADCLSHGYSIKKHAINKITQVKGKSMQSTYGIFFRLFCIHRRWFSTSHVPFTGTFNFYG